MKKQATLKTLEDFDAKHNEDGTPLYVAYSNVPFKELKTFDLMRLLRSARNRSSHFEAYEELVENIDCFLFINFKFYVMNTLFGQDIIQSISFDEGQILRWILDLHCPMV